MNIREGLIPTALGTAVTATGYAMKQNRGSNKMVAEYCVRFWVSSCGIRCNRFSSASKIEKKGERMTCSPLCFVIF